MRRSASVAASHSGFQTALTLRESDVTGRIPLRDGIGLGESVDAVLERALAGRDGGPEHRRERGLERGQVTHRAAFDKALETGI